MTRAIAAFVFFRILIFLHVSTGFEMTDFLGCGKCGETQLPLLRCDTCRTVRYCSDGCQKEDAMVHTLLCKSKLPIETYPSPIATATTAETPTNAAPNIPDGKDFKAKEHECKAGCCNAGKHQLSAMPALTLQQRDLHRTTMTKFIGTEWTTLFRLYLSTIASL